MREPLSFGDLPCLAGGARRLFGRALRLLRDASGLRSAICLRGALRLESATRFLLGGARFILCDPRLLLRGLCLRRRCVRFARRVRDRARLTADVFEELGEYTAQCIRRESTRIRCGLLGYLLLRYSRFAPRAAQRGKATSPVRCDLVDEAVALLAEPLDLFDQHLPLVTGLLEDLLGGVLGACADLVSSAQRAGQGVAYGRIELLVDRNALVCGIELRLERADALGELADTIGERADDVAGRA